MPPALTCAKPLPGGRPLTTLRITAGTLRGRRVSVPPADVRPTGERARQAFFNIVAPRIDGARFLDLFAGSGVFAFEAVSRGARSATAVDIAPRNTAAIERLAGEWDVAVKAITGDAIRTLRRLDTQFDLIYADPPYDFADYDALLAALDRSSCIAPDALVAIEHRRKTEPFQSETTRLQKLRRAEYGEVWITMWEATTESGAPSPEP